MNATDFEGKRTLDTVVIGGGQAGLAVGRSLARRHRDVVILDALERVGDAWRLRWDSLRLFTPAKYDGLAGLPFPGDPLAFPSKDEQGDYLEEYAARFRLPVRTSTRVDRLWRENDHFEISSGDRRWAAETVIVATGGCQSPHVPQLSSGLAADVNQLHSSEYHGPADLRPGPVVVVGMGNSGAEIALEASRTHPTWISGEPSGELPVRHGRAAARFALPFVRFAGLHVLTLNTPIGRKIAPKMTAHATPLIRTKRAELGAAGVQTLPRISGTSSGNPVFGSEQVQDLANVIWCTGYRNDFDWIDLPAFDQEGRPRQRRGVVESVPGLYFLGLEFMFSAVSATLPGVGRDARYLAKRISSSKDRAAH
jgi:putative flavoprotein involved in K+ transport